MENNRRQIPSQSSNYVGSGNPSRGGSSPATGDYAPGVNYSQDKSANFYNAPLSRPIAPPPGFTLQQSGMNGFTFAQLPNVPINSTQCYFPSYDNFGNPPNNTAYSNFYPPNSTPHRMTSDQDFSNVSSLGQHQCNNNVGSNGYELDKGLNMLLNSGHLQQHAHAVSHLPKPLNVENATNNGGIKPIIDNIVGSMGMSNGMYTHFGSVTAPFVSRPENVPQYFRSELNEQNTVEKASPSACSPNEKGPSIGTIGSGVDTNNSSSNARSSTPNDAMDSGSRPQTPGKPSYSEILAKSTAQNGSSSTAATVRKVASPSPNNMNKTSSNADSNQSIQLQGHRKSFDYVHMSSNSSAASSSCASASSSPVVKQKAISQSIVGRLFNSNKGKENNIEPHNSKSSNSSSYSRSTTSNTPTHQKQAGTQLPKNEGSVGNERKVLASSQNSATGGGPKSKASSSGKPSKVSYGQNSFDFEIEDLDDDGEAGWKTYTSRTNKSHLNRSGGSNVSGKEGKRHSNGNGGSSSGGLASASKNDTDNNNENREDGTGKDSRRESLSEKKLSNSQVSGFPSSIASGGGIVGSGSQARKTREKEKTRNRKDDRNCRVRKVERFLNVWAAHMISAVAWLFKLVTDVITLSFSVGSTLVEDLLSWWRDKVVPTCIHHFQGLEDGTKSCLRRLKQFVTSWRLPFRRKVTTAESEEKKNAQDLLAALGPERNIALPTNGDEALKRLLSVKGQDPYSILGVRSDSSDETVRRYYKKQAVLVHPDKNLVLGAEEAFKILARAFELIGEPLKRQEYHRKLIEAHAKEQVYGEIGKLLEQLRKKMEIASSSIRCTKCNSRHKKNKTDRPLFAARYCAQCGIHHGAREGELWAEKRGWFAWSWNYFACMDCHIWEINEWAKCQKKNLLHIKPNSHCVMYRLIAGNGSNQQGQHQGSNGNVGGHAADGHGEHEDDWDSLINNLYKSTGGVPGGKSGSHFYQQGKGGSSSCPGGTTASSSTSATGRKRKGKRK